MKKLILLSALCISTFMFSQKVENKKLEISKTKLLKVKVLSDLITNLPKSETIISYEMVYKSEGKVVSAAKKVDDLIKEITEKVDTKSSIYLDIKCKNSNGKMMSYVYSVFVSP